MKLNCKAGDLAIFIKSYAGNEGKVVRLIRFIGVDPHWNDGDNWETDTEITGSDGSKACIASDSHLRPLRDNDGQDETLTWKEVTKELENA